MKELKETIKNILVENKSKVYAIDEKRYGFSLGDDDYRKVTGVDLETLSLEYGETHVYGEVRYCRTNEGYELQYETFINDESRDSLSGVIVAPDYSQDWLEMFSTNKLPDNWKELITNEMLHDILVERNIQTIECLQDDDVPDEMKNRIVQDNLKTWLEGETQTDGSILSNVEVALNLIREEHPEKWNDYLADELSVSDIPDSLIEDCAHSYISDNPSSSCSDAMFYMSRCDTKDVIKDIIDNL